MAFFNYRNLDFNFMSHLTQQFTATGGNFLTPEADIIEKLKQIKAFVFDWDGVFTDASKDHLLNSRFNEADSMGTNLLRFSYYLNKKELPIVSIISGENNITAFTLINRERFQTSYSKFANKLDAAKHLCDAYQIQLHQICFVFDDVLDLTLAEHCGIRIFIPRKAASPLFNDYVIKHKLADYITASGCGDYAVREACELLIGLNGNFEKVISERVSFSEDYSAYLSLKKQIEPKYYTTKEGEIILQNDIIK